MLCFVNLVVRLVVICLLQVVVVWVLMMVVVCGVILFRCVGFRVYNISGEWLYGFVWVLVLLKVVNVSIGYLLLLGVIRCLLWCMSSLRLFVVWFILCWVLVCCVSLLLICLWCIWLVVFMGFIYCISVVSWVYGGLVIWDRQVYVCVVGLIIVVFWFVGSLGWW